MKRRPLNVHDIGVLKALCVACDEATEHPKHLVERIGYVTGEACGFVSYQHWYPMKKLAQRGLCLRTKFGGDKGRRRYRITPKGRKVVAAHFAPDEAN